MTTSARALSDLPPDLPGLTRIETTDLNAATPVIADMLRSVYPHDQVFGRYCTVEQYIEAPPREVFEYLADTRSLEEWTYSTRGFTRAGGDGLWHAYDLLGEETEIYTRTVSNCEAMTVDYHCAWDQKDHLWMVYLMRVVDAQVVFDKPGSVVLWTNCHHPFYDDNPYAETAPRGRDSWVGDYWDMFSAGHRIEMSNLKTICEYRHSRGLSIRPNWMEV